MNLIHEVWFLPKWLHFPFIFHVNIVNQGNCFDWIDRIIYDRVLLFHLPPFADKPACVLFMRTPSDLCLQTSN